ncbi:Inner membrane protein YqjA [Candidatus Gullanella endobia]|uniref:Inner membrane protein YqjA n=1 Tax=Candidatus Gullanella endobia TaxID=1070130 RepID=A0A143WRB0_9ENTR|nr:DedA family protein [Candidatus Gullanella endobia]CUX96258.1 Inner membrane protein YqjA [Candidatus Gullanella endobia]
MGILKELLYALWQQDFETLSNPNLVLTIYFLACTILFLENSLLLAAFLPGDSLLILLGVLISKGTLSFVAVLFLLTISASLGSWIGYLYGKWLGSNRVVKNWLSHLPEHYHQRAYRMFHHHGLSALIIGRFFVFIRTLLPAIIGLSGLSSSRFQFFNCISAFLWIFILTLIGFFLGKIPIFKRYEEKLMLCLMLLPLVLLTLGLISSFIFIFRRKRLTDSNR